MKSIYIYIKLGYTFYFVGKNGGFLLEDENYVEVEILLDQAFMMTDGGKPILEENAYFELIICDIDRIVD